MLGMFIVVSNYTENIIKKWGSLSISKITKNDESYDYINCLKPMNDPIATGVNGLITPGEGFAESVAAYCYPATAQSRVEKAGDFYENYYYTPRGQYIGELMVYTSKE
jgi:hypothetical protein